MTGVDILSSSEVGCNPEPMWGLSLIIGGVLFFIFAIIGVTRWCKYIDFKEFIGFTLIGLLFGGFMCAFSLEITNEFNYTDTQTQYKVTISEEVNFVEFNEKYEIIDQEGKIYTIIERK